jgi:Lysine methyltransferase
MVITAQYVTETFTFYHEVDATAALPSLSTSTTTSVTDHGVNASSSNSNNSCNSKSSNPSTCSLKFHPVLHVTIQYATTSAGGTIVSSKHDTTGIFVWPATYVLCQYFILEYNHILLCSQPQPHPVQHPPQPQPQKKPSTIRILELGCGCGMVGSTFLKYHQQQQQRPNHTNDLHILWYATDRDTTALQLTKENGIRNCIPSYGPFSSNYDCLPKVEEDVDQTTNRRSTTSVGSALYVQPLLWGDTNDIQLLLRRLRHSDTSMIQGHTQSSSLPTTTTTTTTTTLFDYIVAADIIYPTQTDTSILTDLFRTIDTLLAPNGVVYLSYCHRDPTNRIVQQLIAAATNANFTITAPSSSNATATPHLIDNIELRQKYLPPTLDGQILILHRCTTTDAKQYNDLLGNDSCTIFPGLQTKLQQRAQLQHEEKDQNSYTNNEGYRFWDTAPPVLDDDEETK